MKVIYLLMFSDRDFTEDEKAVFLSAGSEIDPSFSSDKDALIAECTAVIQAAENGNYEQNIHDLCGISSIVHIRKRKIINE